MKPGVQTQRKARRIHRRLVPLASLPLLLTASTGSLYSLLLEQGIDAFWLLKVHTGQFGWLNLQPVYPILPGMPRLHLPRQQSCRNTGGGGAPGCPGKSKPLRSMKSA